MSPAAAASTQPDVPPPRLPSPERPQAEVAQALASRIAGLDWSRVRLRAQPWVEAARREPVPWLALESLLHDYPLSSAEGRALMRLAESLLRVPDAATAALLAADQLGQARFDAGRLAAASRHPQRAGWAARAMNWARELLPAADGSQVDGLLQRLGTPAVVAAATQAVQWLGRQFVLGRDIDEALREAARARPSAPAPLRYSFDMLGEGARSAADADRYLAAYRQALQRVAASIPAGTAVEAADGLSIKLSALHPRFEELQHDRVLPELLPRLWTLVEPAAHAGIPLTLDAEEADRLELTLDVFDALARRVAAETPHWRGLGLAIQAYQTRSAEALDEVLRIAARTGIRPMVRLVKGAYWDAEIKRAQQLGLAAYPVFTHKAHTDLAWLAGAQALLAAGPAVYPQFASHNAGTLAAVLQMAQDAGLALDGSAFELQRLHGMGQAVFSQLARDAAVAGRLPVRVYAPVGAHRELLAYLVRRMLENGANASFVHQLADERLPADVVLASPLISPMVTPLSPAVAPAPAAAPPAPGWSAGLPSAGLPSAGLQVHEPPAVCIPLPHALYGPLRRNARGLDLSCRATRRALLEAVHDHAAPGAVAACDCGHVDALMSRLHAAWPAWDARPHAERADMLDGAARLLEARLPAFCALLVHEAGKTLADAVAEVREAVDACRYYAAQARTDLAPRLLPGPTGERNEWRLRGRGVLACIAPWNFPLAIFGAQVAAALVAGNAVAAKPAEQTPAVARAFVDLLIEAGVPRDVLALLHGPGATVGERLLHHAHLAGVVFTGSTATARRIQRVLAERHGPILPLVAETGGVNAMIVDGTALPEQAVEAIVASAFGSAGQRCSALRLLCVDGSIADGLLQQLAGAIALLRVGDPADAGTDVGPLIDTRAHAVVQAHVERLSASAGAKCLAQAPLPPAGLLPPELAARLLAPSAWLIDDLAWVREEVFGPVLHVLRWGPGCAITDVDALVDAINGLGFGLTLGVQTRIDGRARRIAQRARVGNVYVNRGMTGAVIGVQPFGGEGLSGTGPKAGGPLYLPRLCVEQTVTINTAAAGGNLDLLGG
ncbi:MAG: L-glutamate gamma-semialdehyde dehydrogenase [Burkholderiales bacterium]|nr:L-glutamate gamma-semialdehyde dehydrogenase [Burkholderiales bacterium]